MSGTDTAGPSSERSIIKGVATAPGGIKQQSPAGKPGSLSGFFAWSEGPYFSWVAGICCRTSSDSSVIRSSATAPGGIEQQSSAGKTVSRSGFSARYVFLSSIRSWYDYTFASNEGIFSYQFKT